MTGMISSYCKRLFVSLLILLDFSGTALLSQKNLSGNLNQPNTHVISISASDRVIVDDVTGFGVNDTILLIQMQGVGILTGTLDYGNIQNIFGQPGMHEFLIIQSVNGGTKEIVFRNNIRETFNPIGNIQIVRVPYYNSATVTGRLFCDPWNRTTKKGGVLALIIGRTLKLNADIDVSESGFIGGKDTIGEGRCALVVPFTDIKSYPKSFLNAGYKGEGLAIHDDAGSLLAPFHEKGMGPNFTGGGGSNGRFSGGGGGSNRGAGGIGGDEENSCLAPQAGGLGGITSEQPAFPAFINRIYFGGGGGASTSLTGLSPTGGNGGGIVIIVTDTIIGNGGKILSNGGDGGTAVVNGGSGGGGGGGSIALSLNNYGSTDLTFSVSGGKGGNNPGTFGEGGGGGGGLLYVSTNTTGKVTISLNGGLPGNDPSSTGFAGGTGEKRLGFKAILNGFLFNSIRSSITGDQIDSICSNMVPRKISGTKPVGGTAPYTYLWEKSYDQSTWIPLINDPDPTYYTPTVIETTTVYFRRTITDSSIPTVLVDISKSVKILVQPFIKNNIVGTSDTICFAQDPPAFTSKAILQDGNGIYTYKWQVSLNNSLYTLPANTYNTDGYTPPPALVVTSWYRRTVTSGRCIDSAASAIVKITVLPLITNNNILNVPPDICYGMTFTNLTATNAPTLSGGDNSYKFKWESSINGTTWITATGVNNLVGYNPDELSASFPGNEYYHRVVYSGSNDVCVNASTSVLLKDFPVITNNSISTFTTNQPICSGSAPPKLIGSIPLNGNGTYAYIWQDSTKGHSWTDITGEISLDYQPPALTDTTRYRRKVSSSACSDISNSNRIIVHKPILNNNITLLSGGVTDTICNGQVPGLLQGTTATGGTNIPGNYAYQWQFSTDNINFSPVPTGGTGITYQPPVLTITTYYIRQVTSGACSVLSNATIIITVLQPITGNTISANQTAVCYNTVPDPFTGATLSGGAGAGTYSFLWEQSTDGGTAWTAADGINTLDSYQPPSLKIPMRYKRTVKSGSYDCSKISSIPVDIGINPLPSSLINAGPPDTTIFSFDNVFHMVANPVLAGETGLWTVVSGTGDFDDNSDNLAEVRNLSIGGNTFLWTISKGPCKLEDLINIKVNKEFIPQGFSPNNDEFNNTFIITGLDLPNQIAELTVVNGAGTEVFSTSNRNDQTWTDWDGKNSKGLDLPEGTYYYLLEITSNGQVFKRSGFIVLKRY